MVFPHPVSADVCGSVRNGKRRAMGEENSLRFSAERVGGFLEALVSGIFDELRTNDLRRRLSLSVRYPGGFFFVCFVRSSGKGMMFSFVREHSNREEKRCRLSVSAILTLNLGRNSTQMPMGKWVNETGYV